MDTPEPDYKALFEDGPALYIVLTPDLRIAAVSAAYLRATMTRREDILGRGLFDVFPEKDPAAAGTRNLRASFERVLANRVSDTLAVQKYDIRRPEPEGGGFEERFWSTQSSPILGADGEVAFIIHRVEDVTEFARLKRRGSEMEIEVFQRARELQHANAFSESVIENIPDMIFLKEASTLRFTRLNKAGEELLGIKREDLMGKDDRDFFSKEQADFFIRKDREVLEKGTLVDIPEETIDTSRRGRRVLHTKKIPLLNAAGKADYLLGISEDITLRLEADRKLREAVSIKSDFINMASHELRVPLTAIKMAINIVQDEAAGGTTAQQKRFLDLARRNVERLVRLINDLLDFQKMDVGRFEFRIRDDDLGALLRETADGFRPVAEQKGLSLEVDLPAGPIRLPFDKDRISQVLANFISNALKFTARGRIRLSARLSAEGARVSVEDQGVGISPADMGKLFKSFAQLDAGRSAGGTGLGLALAKQIVEHHGGAVGADSEKGRGSTFFFTLPAAAAAR